VSFFNELSRRNVFRVGIAYVVVAWLILQVADVILNNIEAPGWVFETILLVLLAGLPVILLFAWAFELTPEGLKRERDVDRSISITPQTGKRLDRVTIVVMTLALAYFAYDKFFLGGSEQAVTGDVAETSAPKPPAEAAPVRPLNDKSIAVLPLANRSAREEDQYFTDGIHDDLLTQLAKVASLKVISRTSVMRYRDTELPIPEIAQQLGVTTILEGGIQRAGDQIRINVQLIDAATDEHLWAETYDRKMTAENLFAIQSEITRQIIDALKATLTPDEAARIDSRPTDDLEALQEFMKGQQVLAARTVAGINEAMGHFKAASEMDPGFAQALVGQANALHLLYEYAGLPEEETFGPAMELLEQALALAPDLGEAYLVRAEILRHKDQLEDAEADFLRAQELLPGNATVLHWFSFLRQDQGRRSEYYDLLERAHQLDPMSAVIHANWAMRPYYEGDGEDSLVELQRVKSLHPEYPFTYSMESWIRFNRGDPVGALRAQLKILELDPESTRNGFHCFSYLTLDARESARKCIEDFEGPRPARRLFAQFLLFLIDNDPASAKALAEQSEEIAGNEYWRAYTALNLGEFEQARPAFEKFYSGWFEPGTAIEIDPDDASNAIDSALLMQRTGASERATELLQAAVEIISALPRNRGAHATGFLDVQAYALLGQTERALQALEECANLEYLSGWQGLGHLPHYDSLRGDPRFNAAVDRLRRAADAARERAAAEGLL
jgi:TolB-like protein/Tfp pilus assembly protein PilF